MTQDWSEAELAYMAGIVDGEGCISISGGRGRGKLHVANTNPLLLQWIQKRFGGSIAMATKKNPRWKPSWHWSAPAHILVPILQRLIPYLVIKKRQAEVLIAYRATIARGHGTLTLDKEAVRAAFRTEMHTLNRIGADQVH